MIDDATIKRVASDLGLVWEYDGKIISPYREETDITEYLFAVCRAIEQLARQEQREEDASIAANLFHAAADGNEIAEAIRASGKENSNE